MKNSYNNTDAQSAFWLAKDVVEKIAALPSRGFLKTS
jgi:hypothetical protein